MLGFGPRQDHDIVSGRIDGVVTRYQKVHHDSQRFLCDSDSDGSTSALGSRRCCTYGNPAKVFMAVSPLPKSLGTRIGCGGTCEDGRHSRLPEAVMAMTRLCWRRWLDGKQVDGHLMNA
jgi:hypothetical protein